MNQPSDKQGGVYVASRVSRADVWKNLRDNMGVSITSSWIDEAGEGDTDDFGELWTRITREIEGSTGLVFYGHTADQPWKGALVEVGIALALGKPVAALILGELDGRTMRPVGSWLHHPLVRRFTYMEDAIEYAQSGAPQSSSERMSVLKNDLDSLEAYVDSAVVEATGDKRAVLEDIGNYIEALKGGAVSGSRERGFGKPMTGAGEPDLGTPSSIEDAPAAPSAPLTGTTPRTCACCNRDCHGERERLERELAAARSTTLPRWIPFSEGLPENPGPDVLVAGSNDGTKIWQAASTGPHDPAWRERYNVTHWMPMLPAPVSATGERNP